MTALARYDLLEAVGWYAERPEREPVEVLVSFGDASLTILRFDDTPLAHWPLGSLVETPGAAPLTLAPDADAPERLALSDAEMIAAIRALRPGGARKQPSAARARARRLARRAAALAAAALALFALWLATPRLIDALAEQTPPDARAALGDTAIARFAGDAACDTVAGRRALIALGKRLSAAQGGGPVVLRVAALAAPAPEVHALAAPGGRVVLFAATLDAAESEDALLRAAAAALAQAALRSPTAAALRDAGLMGLRLALTGDLRGAGLTGAAVAALRAPALAPPEAVAATVAHTMAALAADGAPALPEASWRALKAICG